MMAAGATDVSVNLHAIVVKPGHGASELDAETIGRFGHQHQVDAVNGRVKGVAVSGAVIDDR